MRLARKFEFFLLTMALLFLAGRSVFFCEIRNSDFEAPRDVRDQLTADDLLNGRFLNLVHNDYFMPIGEASAPAHLLFGSVHFAEKELSTSHPDRDWMGRGQRIFPSFSLPLISSGEHLIPLNRDIIVSGNQNNSFWNIIVSPGHVWQEPGDNGYSRASFPFVLTDNFLGQARNGIATFVYNSSEISNVAVQVTQETSPVNEYVTSDFYGIVPVQLTSYLFSDRDQVILDFEKELDARPPVRPWSDLSMHSFTRSFFNGGMRGDEVSTSALFMDGEIFMQPAETRTGQFPYPLNMRHGVFSVTKSLGMGLSMFYMAERYGESIFDELITDHIPLLSGHPGWQGVTFEHALCMATGTWAGDEGDDIYYFIMARTAEEKIGTVNDLPDDSPAPGESLDYASSNTFVLSYALNQYVKAKEGVDADFWLMVKENVLKPMRIEHLPVARTIESDGSLGTPIMGWGSYPNIIEAVKVARLLHNEGVFQGKQLLNRNKVREALYRTSRQGYDGGFFYGRRHRYLHSIWGVEVGLSTYNLNAPAMRGMGGNHIVILPSGVIAVRFSDENYYDISPMVAVAEYYRSSPPE